MYIKYCLIYPKQFIIKKQRLVPIVPTMHNPSHPLHKLKYFFSVIMVRRSISMTQIGEHIIKVSEDMQNVFEKMDELNFKFNILHSYVKTNETSIKEIKKRIGFSSAPRTKNTSSKGKYIKKSNHVQRKPNQEKSSLEVKKGPTTLKGIQFYSSLSLWGKSHVWSGLNGLDLVCIKTYNIKTDINSIQREKETLKFLDHPNIPKFFVLKKKPSSTNLVMEYCGQMTLGKLIKGLNLTQTLQEREARRIFVQILKVFEYLEAKGLAHCNLSPDKIVLQNQKVKVVSFRHSVFCNLETKINWLQKISHYNAPEIQSKIGFNPLLADRWMLGIILLHLIIPKNNFFLFVERNMIENVRKGEFFFPEEVSQPSRKLVQGFLKINPTERLSPQEALQSSWMTEIVPKWSQERYNSV